MKEPEPLGVADLPETWPYSPDPELIYAQDPKAQARYRRRAERERQEAADAWRARHHEGGGRRP